MASRRRKSKRRGNPEYSDAVRDLGMDFSEVLDNAANKGYAIAKKIETKTGRVRLSEMILKISESLTNASESLEDEIDD